MGHDLILFSSTVQQSHNLEHSAASTVRCKKEKGTKMKERKEGRKKEIQK
jgi:hypothetical protein